jgi:hypothetical protein
VFAKFMLRARFVNMVTDVNINILIKCSTKIQVTINKMMITMINSSYQALNYNLKSQKNLI